MQNNLPIIQDVSERVNVLGVGISVTNMSDALTAIEGWIESRECHYVCVTGVHGVVECQKDEGLKKIHNVSGLTVPDGMPLVWIGRFNGYRNISRKFLEQVGMGEYLESNRK